MTEQERQSKFDHAAWLADLAEDTLRVHERLLRANAPEDVLRSSRHLMHYLKARIDTTTTELEGLNE